MQANASSIFEDFTNVMRSLEFTPHVNFKTLHSTPLNLRLFSSSAGWQDKMADS